MKYSRFALISQNMKFIMKNQTGRFLQVTFYRSLLMTVNGYLQPSLSETYVIKFIYKNFMQKIDAKITVLCRFKLAIFTCFEKSNQGKIELGYNEASEEDFLTSYTK
jgi:hypothetical protein